MNRLDKIATDIALAQQTIPNGDITTEPGASILAARLRLQNEHAPDILAVVREVATVAVPVGVTPSDDSWWKGHEEAMRRVRVQLTPLNETTNPDI